MATAIGAAPITDRVAVTRSANPTVGVEPDAAFANDGVISDDEVKAGGAAVSV